MNKEISVSAKTMKILNNGCWAEVGFLNSVHNAVLGNINSLSRNRQYTAKRICGEEFWSQLDDGTRRTAGWCVSHLVATQQVPLIYVGKDSENAKKYQRV